MSYSYSYRELELPVPSTDQKIFVMTCYPVDKHSQQVRRETSFWVVAHSFDEARDKVWGYYMDRGEGETMTSMEITTSKILATDRSGVLLV